MLIAIAMRMWVHGGASRVWQKGGLKPECLHYPVWVMKISAVPNKALAAGSRRPVWLLAALNDEIERLSTCRLFM